MPRDNSGAYTAPSSSWNPAIDGQSADTSDWNGLLEDIVAALTGSLAANGVTPTTAIIPFAYGIGVAPGSITSPAVQITSDSTTGFYAPGAGQLTFLCSGANVLSLSTSAVAIPTGVALTLNGAVAANGNVQLAGASSTLGFYGSAGTTKPTVTGAKGGDAALGSLISALAALGLITDATSA